MNSLFETLSVVVPDNLWLIKLNNERLISNKQYDYIGSYLKRLNNDYKNVIEIAMCRIVFHKSDDAVFESFITELFDKLNCKITDENNRFTSLAEWMLYWDLVDNRLDKILKGDYNIDDVLNILSTKHAYIDELMNSIASTSIDCYRYIVTDIEWNRTKNIFDDLNIELRYYYKRMLCILDNENMMYKMDKLNNLISIMKARIPTLLAFKVIVREMQTACDNKELESMLLDDKQSYVIADSIIDKYFNRKNYD